LPSSGPRRGTSGSLRQLGSDKPAVRLAGVYAMAGLADDWKANRQTCVDVLCAYLQLPYELDPGPAAAESQRLAFQASQKVRHTVIRAITARLRKNKDHPTSWQGLDLDFTGVVFDGGDFSFAQFSGGTVLFHRAEFPGGKVGFDNARFSGGIVDFSYAQFSGGEVSFVNAEFSGAEVRFSDARFSGGWVLLNQAEFLDGAVIDFNRALFLDGTVVSFGSAKFSGGTVDFIAAEFSGGTVSFVNPDFLGGTLFSGGIVDFSKAKHWSTPPTFPWTDRPPPGVKLPRPSGKAN
jgi:hypothetical protein